MNKPYFAQYIPVEGEIPLGKRVPVFKGGILYHFELETQEKLNLFLKLPGSISKGVKPAKLFVCSSDIRSGDEFYPKLGAPLERFMDSYREPTDDWFKIIGEPSPDATWVKEGMMFEDDDIEHGGGYILFYAAGMTHWTKVEPKDQQCGKGDEKIGYPYVKIKGPCGHFH